VIPDTSEMWEELSDRLRSFIAPRVGSTTDTEDVLQEVLFRIYRSIDSLQRAERIHAWVYQIARNAIADHHRAKAARRELSSGDGAEVVRVPDVPAADGFNESDPRQELTRCLLPMIDRLPDRYREAIVLTELEGWTQRGAAAQLGLSLSGAKSRVQRGRRRLKEMLLECCRIELDRLGGISDYEVREEPCRFCGNDDPGPSQTLPQDCSP
jgi:RNA polymerase sigma-70 factor (ECF subfamily)